MGTVVIKIDAKVYKTDNVLIEIRLEIVFTYIVDMVRNMYLVHGNWDLNLENQINAKPE